VVLRRPANTFPPREKMFVFVQKCRRHLRPNRRPAHRFFGIHREPRRSRAYLTGE
jgi:hypothetical protein